MSLTSYRAAPSRDNIWKPQAPALASASLAYLPRIKPGARAAFGLAKPKGFGTYAR